MPQDVSCIESSLLLKPVQSSAQDPTRREIPRLQPVSTFICPSPTHYTLTHTHHFSVSHSSRVDDQMRETFLHIAREGRSTSLKRKRQREKQKLKLQEKREKMLAETRVRDWDDLKDEVRFGEVAEAPPTLTAIPKARKKAKMVILVIALFRFYLLYISYSLYIC